MRKLLILAFVLLAGTSLAHAELRSSEPAAASVLAEGPGHVALQFSEALETMFSVFKVYPLGVEMDLEADNAEQRLNGLAAALVSEVLELRDDADDQVPFELVSDSATTDSLTLEFSEPLAPGHWVVMWRVLSIDTHVTQGFFVFSVED